MTNNNIFLPKRIKVGFQKRSDTYTGSLGYIIYFDQKGVLRKETSWQGWRDKTIEAQEFDNEPTEGFVLNKRVGGGSSSHYYYHDHVRDTKIRIYDPRGFEFEITVPNLLYILENCTSVQGKGLEGKFVYGWEGKDLVLIPENAPEYKDMRSFTELQDLKVKKADMVIGRQYYTRQNELMTYLGFHPEYLDERKWKRNTGYTQVKSNSKKHWFWSHKYGGSLVTLAGLSKIAKEVSDELDPKFLEYYEHMESSIRFCEVDHYLFEDITIDDAVNNAQRWVPLYRNVGNRRFAITLDVNSYWSNGAYVKDGTASINNIVEVELDNINKTIGDGTRYLYNREAKAQIFAACGLHENKRYSPEELLSLGLQKHTTILKNGRKQK